MPAAGLAVPCTVVPFLVVVVPAGDKLDFVFSETGESHEFAFGCSGPIQGSYASTTATIWGTSFPALNNLSM